MSQFYIVNESTEDTFEATGDLQDAIRMAREMAGLGPVGDPVSILDSGGMAIRQYLRLQDGTVAEQPIIRPGKVSGDEAERDRAKPGATDRPRDPRSLAS
jgi:hypothetical protein